VEVTPEWALLWWEARIKVSETADGGVVELSAPPEACGAPEWELFADELFRAIAARVAVSAARTPSPPLPTP
jgi:hypothetical protein